MGNIRDFKLAPRIGRVSQLVYDRGVHIYFLTIIASIYRSQLDKKYYIWYYLIAVSQG